MTNDIRYTYNAGSWIATATNNKGERLICNRFPKSTTEEQVIEFCKIFGGIAFEDTYTLAKV